MSIEFLLVGGVIFAVYVWFTLWIILSQNKKQREENYPNKDNSKNKSKTDWPQLDGLLYIAYMTL